MKRFMFLLAFCVGSLYAGDCTSRYASLLQQYDGAIKTGSLLIQICDKAGDLSSDCKQAQGLFTQYDLKPLLRYLDQYCPNIYDSQFKLKVDQYSAVYAQVKTRDKNDLLWRGDPERLKAFMKKQKFK